MTEIKRPDCPVCGGQGWYEITVSAHDPNCDGSCSNCPVPERGQEQCQICSYFDDAEAALAAKDKEIEGPRSQITENAIKELKAWKESQMEVEGSWDVQAVAKELGIGLGQPIRAQILPCIVELKAERDKAVKRAEKAEAIIKEYGDAISMAVISKDRQRHMMIGGEGEIPLATKDSITILDEGREPVMQKPNMEVEE